MPLIHEASKIMTLKYFMKSVNLFFFGVTNLCPVTNSTYSSIMLTNRKGAYSEILDNIILVLICKVENNRDLA